jgi:predicted nuclease of predicted toxin-antitoxin system
LGDVNLEKSFVRLIKDFGYDIKKVSEIDCYMIDEEIIKLGIKESRIIITEDKDLEKKSSEIIFQHMESYLFGLIQKTFFHCRKE